MVEEQTPLNDTVPDHHEQCFAMKSNKKQPTYNPLARGSSDEDGIAFTRKEPRSVDVVQTELIVQVGG